MPQLSCSLVFRDRARVVALTLAVAWAAAGATACATVPSSRTTTPPATPAASPGVPTVSPAAPSEPGSGVLTATPAVVDPSWTVALARIAEGGELTVEGPGAEVCLGSRCRPLRGRVRFVLPRPTEAVLPGHAWLPVLTVDGVLVDPRVVALDPGLALSALPAARHLSDLRGALLAPFAATRVLEAGAVHVHLAAVDEASLDQLEERVRQAAAAAFGRFGTLGGSVAIGWAPSDAPPSAGARWARLTRARLPASAAELPGLLEALTSSVATPVEPGAAPTPAWLRLGLGRYGAWLLTSDLRGAPTGDALHVLARAYERHRVQTRGRAIAEGDDPDGAALVLFCADAALRQAGSSLADALAPSVHGFVERLRRARPEIATALEGRLAFRGVLDLDACTRPLGVRLQARHAGRLGDEAWSQLFEGAVVEDGVVTREGGRLRVGDVLLRLGEVPIAGRRDVELALLGRSPGDRVPSLWARGGRSVRVSLPVPFGATERVVRFTLEPDEGALGARFPFAPR